MRKNIVLLGLITTLFSSCVKKIDATSEEAMKSSIEEIKKSLNDDKKKKFEESMELIMFHEFDIVKLIQEGEYESFSDMKYKLDGKTADDIIAEGEKIQTEINVKKKEEAKNEIEELYHKMEQMDKDKIMLTKFEVKRSRFYKRRKGRYYITEEPIIELTVMNGTDKSVSRCYFTGTLVSPNRSVPWIKDEFNCEISGGIEPKEEATWYLTPNMFSNWGEIDVPKDAILIVEVNQLDGADGKEIYSLNNFGEIEQERLEELLLNYPEFKK